MKPTDVTFATNQVRIRLPRDQSRAWGLTQAVVANPEPKPKHGKDHERHDHHEKEH